MPNPTTIVSTSSTPWPAFPVRSRARISSHSEEKSPRTNAHDSTNSDTANVPNDVNTLGAPRNSPPTAAISANAESVPTAAPSNPARTTVSFPRPKNSEEFRRLQIEDPLMAKLYHYRLLFQQAISSTENRGVFGISMEHTNFICQKLKELAMEQFPDEPSPQVYMQTTKIHSAVRRLTKTVLFGDMISDLAKALSARWESGNYNPGPIQYEHWEIIESDGAESDVENDRMIDAGNEAAGGMSNGTTNSRNNTGSNTRNATRNTTKNNRRNGASNASGNAASNVGNNGGMEDVNNGTLIGFEDPAVQQVMRGILRLRNVRGGMLMKLDPAFRGKRESAVFGHNDLTVGDWWPYQLCCLRDGVHGHKQGGIAGRTAFGAYSIVVSADSAYNDDDEGYSLLYSGTRGTKAIESSSVETKLTDATRSLETSRANQKPVRVIRKGPGKGRFAPSCGYRYDGLYTVINSEVKRGENQESDFAIFWLVRIEGQKPLEEVIRERPTEEEKQIFRKLKG